MELVRLNKDNVLTGNLTASGKVVLVWKTIA